MSSLRLQFAVTPEEASQAQSLALRQQIGGGSNLATWLILIAAFGILLGTFYFKIPPGQRVLWFGVVLAIWIIVYATMQFAKRPKHPPETNEVEITPQRLRLSVAGTELDHSWAAFSQVFESGALFVLLDRSKTVLITLPKRAFPDRASQDWFRSLLEAAITPTPIAAAELPPGAADRPNALTLHVRYTYLDCLDYTLASWFTRGAMLVGVGIVTYAVIHSHLHPVPNPGRSRTAAFLMMLPFFVLFVCVYPIITSVKHWFAARKQLTPSSVAIDDQGVTMTEPTGDTHLAWSNLRFYKETRRLFILWNSPRAPALMLPRRAFSSEADVQKLRALLTQHLQSSTWLLA